jgi:hypothetical protein
MPNRRERRELARQMAKEILQGSRPDGASREKKAKVLTYIGLGAGFGSWGYFVLAPDPSVAFGSALLILCFLFCVGAFWEFFNWTLRIKLPLTVLMMCGLCWGGFYWVSYISRPSFVFVVPGVVANGNSWDFIVNHRGPKSSESVEILFTDIDAQMDILGKSPKLLSPEDINKYQILLRYPSVNPGGRGSLFAQQFIWKPLVFGHEHYAIEITAADRRIHQDLQIEEIRDKWSWATQIKDTATGKQLLNCRDKDFPYGGEAPIRCFPEMTQPSD